MPFLYGQVTDTAFLTSWGMPLFNEKKNKKFYGL
jgi:hypothetical protein